MAANMEDLVKEIQNLKNQVQGLLQHQGFPKDQDVMEEDNEEEDAQAPADWTSVLGVPRASPTRADAMTLCQLFSSPPPLGMVKNALSDATKFEGVPPTPPPRANKLDKQLWTTQQKMETAMNLMVAQLETGDASRMATAGAMIRSAWEDLNENRRRLMAGRQSYALEARKDMDQTRLLTKEEAEKVRKARSSKATQPATQGKGNNAPRQWKPDWNTQGQSTWKPSGKGRGRGKGQKEQK